MANMEDSSILRIHCPNKNYWTMGQLRPFSLKQDRVLVLPFLIKQNRVFHIAMVIERNMKIISIS